MTLTATDFEALKDEALRAFDSRVSQTDPNMCWEFDTEVSRLESQLVQFYAIAARMAKNEDDLPKIAEIWKTMTHICDSFATHLQGLIEKHPYCSASHDKVLDIRNKCERLRMLHA
jgi:hypothetical protein